MATLLIENVQLIQNDGLRLGHLLIRNGKIEKMSFEESFTDIPVDQKLNGNGNYLIPGMIDVHIHGADGFDMMDGTVESVKAVSTACARTGCTSFLATSVTSSFEDLNKMIDNVIETVGKEPGAQIVGLHLEGPYLNAKRKGMQNERFLRHPDLDEMAKILSKSEGLVKMVTLASELPGGLELIGLLKEHGIVPALAHSDATYEEAKLAFKSGANHVTHCFNGMRPIHHRDPGLVLAAFEEEHVSVQAIVDDVHLHPATVRLMYREKGADRMVLITDALQAMGMGDGTYLFGGHEVTVSNGVATLSDGTLASSTITMNKALEKAIKAGIPFIEAVKMATETPANLLGLANKGRLKEGADADFVLLNDQFDVLKTFVNGNIVYAS